MNATVFAYLYVYLSKPISKRIYNEKESVIYFERL